MLNTSETAVLTVVCSGQSIERLPREAAFGAGFEAFAYCAA
jgi:hypothetical protein